jgi:hypothetical protein
MTAADDFAGADFGDVRLTRRLVRIAEGLGVEPSASLPHAAKGDAELEATYRFLSSEKVSSAGILAPHFAATVERAKRGTLVLCAHDTTELSFSSERAGLGRINDGGQGFFAHVSLAMRDDAARSPLGVLDLRTHTRHGPSRKNKHTERIAPSERESYRWRESIQDVAARLEGHAEVVHLLDSEADAYLLLDALVLGGHRFVVRATHRRSVTNGEGERRPLGEALASAEGIFDCRVPLSPRSAPARKEGSRKRNLTRDGRVAHLSFSAAKVVLHRPHGEQVETKTLTINVVHVRELDAPADAEAVEWFLYTTEPIETGADVQRVVDFYRARWRIEELFKALKTGCAFEKRQLESFETLRNALAIFLPLACDLLSLRAIAREDPARPAREVLEPHIMTLLQRHPRSKLPPDATIETAMFAVARFGGHIKNNGSPGWMVLGRGYEKVVTLAEGLCLANEMLEESTINP